MLTRCENCNHFIESCISHRSKTVKMIAVAYLVSLYILSSCKYIVSSVYAFSVIMHLYSYVIVCREACSVDNCRHCTSDRDVCTKCSNGYHLSAPDQCDGQIFLQIYSVLCTEYDHMSNTLDFIQTLLCLFLLSRFFSQNVVIYGVRCQSYNQTYLR